MAKKKSTKVFNSFEQFSELGAGYFEKPEEKDNLSNALQDRKADITRILGLNINKCEDQKIVDMIKKVQGMLDKALVESKKKEVKDFTNSVDLSKRGMKNGVYKGVITQKNKEGVLISIGSSFGVPAEYELLYKDLPKGVSKKALELYEETFVGLEKLDNGDLKINYATEKEFHQPLLDELKKLGITIGDYKPIFYMTKSSDILKGKIVSLGDDVFGEQVVFQTKDGKKKFPISIVSLKEGMFKAKSAHQKVQKIPTFKKNISDKKLIKK